MIDGVERVLVVTAHPDDVDFGAGGTVAKFTATGVQVSYCIITSGDAGGLTRAWPDLTSQGSAKPSSALLGRLSESPM